MNVEHRTLNVQHRIMNSVNLKILSKTTSPDWLRRPRVNLPFEIRLGCLRQATFGLSSCRRLAPSTFEMNIAEGLKTGGFELAREQIASQGKVRGVPG